MCGTDKPKQHGKSRGGIGMDARKEKFQKLQLKRFLYSHFSPFPIGVLLLWICAVPEWVANLIFIVGVGLYFAVVEVFRIRIYQYGQKMERQGREIKSRLLKWCVETEKRMAEGTGHNMIRPHEREIVSAGGWYAAGLCTAYIFFPTHILLSAHACLVFGDFGARHYGIYMDGRSRKWLRGKSLAGMWGFVTWSWVVLGLMIALHGFVPLYPASMSVAQVAAMLLAGVGVGCVFEVYSGRYDNLTIIASSAAAMWFVS